jgi:hypothetical protein
MDVGPAGGIQRCELRALFAAPSRFAAWTCASVTVVTRGTLGWGVFFLCGQAASNRAPTAVVVIPRGLSHSAAELPLVRGAAPHRRHVRVAARLMNTWGRLGWLDSWRW